MARIELTEQAKSYLQSIAITAVALQRQGSIDGELHYNEGHSVVELESDLRRIDVELSDFLED